MICACQLPVCLSLSVLEHLVAVVHSTQPFRWLTFLSLRDATSNSMAPVLTRDATRRDSDTGKTSSIFFAVIAFLVVVACILWGYFIPKWRHRYRRPSRTRSNCICDAAKYRLSTPPKAPRHVPRFPSHPGVRGLQNDCSLPIYDPRTETPFPNSSRTGEIVNLHSLTPTPATKPRIPSAFKRPTHDYELPKTPGTLSQLALTDSLVDHDVEEVDESQPGRLVMAPVARSARRPPPLTKQLAVFPTPTSKSSKRFDTLAHPILLFEKLDKLDPRKAPPISTASCPSRSTFTPKSKRHGNSRRNYMPQTTANVKSELGVIDGAEVASGWGHEQSDTKDIIEPPVALPKPIYKSKSQTPVANILNRYDRYAAGVAPRNASLRGRLTPSIEPLNTGASANSNFVRLTTPPTSPSPATSDTILVPTPLRMRRAAARAAAASPTPLQASVRHISPSERPRSLSPGKFAPFSLQKSLKSKRYFRKSIGFYHCKSAVRTAIAIPKQTHINRGSWKGSSVYSRDMKGMSILQDPACAPVISDESGTSLPPNELSLRRANSTDLVKSKIDGWNLHTGDLHISIPPVADWPRPDVDPRSPPLQIDFENPAPLGSRPQENGHTIFGLTMPIPKILVGDNVFDDERGAQSRGRVLKVPDIEMASTESSISRYCGKTAPGGAEWI
jgi:hypothetical protein